MLAKLQIAVTPTYSCPFPNGCWGTISGSGLKPFPGGWFVFRADNGALVATGWMDSSGTLQPTQLMLPCGSNIGSIQGHAQGLGDPPADIRTGFVNSPCG